MCNRYTDAQSEICPHCFPECTGEAGVQCQVSVSSADAGVTPAPCETLIQMQMV